MHGLTQRSAGFTLLELVVVIAILGILVGLAMPSYLDSVQKTRRADAQSKLRQVEVCAARVFVVDSSYADVADDCAPAPDDHYTYSFPAASATNYIVRAVPKPGQDEDACGSMSLNQAGDTTPTTPAYCW